MSEETKSFDLSQVAVSYLAVPLDGGYGDGAAIKFEKVKPDVVTKEGADGSVAFSETNSRQWKVTLTFLSTSTANAKLSAIKQLPAAAAIGPFAVADLSGASTFLSPKARIETWPNFELGAEPTNVEWSFICAECVVFWGGN